MLECTETRTLPHCYGRVHQNGLSQAEVRRGFPPRQKHNPFDITIPPLAIWPVDVFAHMGNHIPIYDIYVIRIHTRIKYKDIDIIIFCSLVYNSTSSETTPSRLQEEQVLKILTHPPGGTPSNCYKDTSTYCYGRACTYLFKQEKQDAEERG